MTDAELKQIRKIVREESERAQEGHLILYLMVAVVLLLLLGR